MKSVLKILLMAFVLGLAYLFVESILSPIRFDKERDHRYARTIVRLKEIRDAQVNFKSSYGRYTANFDSLLNFVKYDSLTVIRAQGSVPEEYIDSLKSRAKAEKLALEQGLITRDTIRVAVIDSMFHNRHNLVDSIRYIPFSGGKEFTLGVATVKASGLPVQVFEASALNIDILRDMDEQLIVNLNDGKPFPGLRVGSLTESNNNAGNWE